jgi:hypothetical protein
MFRFWNDIVASVVKAEGARLIREVSTRRVEIGEAMLQRLPLPPDVELHGECAIGTGERRALTFDAGGIARFVS